MGYFRIFYYVAYIFNTLTRIIKRHGKWLLWFLSIAIFLVVCMYNPKSQAAYIGNQVTPTYQTIQQKYDSICIDFIRRVDRYVKEFGGDISTLKNNFLKLDYYLYYQSSLDDDFGLSSITGGIFNDYVIRVVFYNTNNNYLSLSYSNYEKYYNIEDQIREVTFTSNLANYRVNITNGTSINYQSALANTTYYIPQSLFHYQNKYIYDYFVSGYTLEEIQLLYEMENSLSSIDEKLTEPPEEEDFSTSDLPTDSGVTDPTTSKVDNIFTTFYNVFTGDVESAKRNINITIPFTR